MEAQSQSQSERYSVVLTHPGLHTRTLSDTHIVHTVLFVHSQDCSPSCLLNSAEITLRHKNDQIRLVHVRNVDMIGCTSVEYDRQEFVRVKIVRPGMSRIQSIENTKHVHALQRICHCAHATTVAHRASSVLMCAHQSL